MENNNFEPNMNHTPSEEPNKENLAPMEDVEINVVSLDGALDDDSIFEGESVQTVANEIADNEVKNQDNDLELDPAIESIGDTDFNNSQPKFDFQRYEVENEPITPIMPQIAHTPYVPTEKEGHNNGMKVFAIIVALLILISGCITGGYLMGSFDKNSADDVKVDLASKPEPENAMSVSAIYEQVNKSIVGIYVYNSTGIASSASGVIYSEDGYVVTNDHIYSEVSSPKFKVYLSDGRSFDADYIAGDTRSDLAVLKIKNPENLRPATFGNSNQLAVGETVVAIGRPNGATEKTIASQGVISDTGRRVSITSSYTGMYIQTDSAINPGSSGGALCNLYGQVVGITSAKLVGDEYDGVGFAIPTTIMKNNVELLIEHKYVKGRAKLGISYQEIDLLTAEIQNSPSGLLIASIDESSDLYDKSVEIGDIITGINGEKIENSDTVLDIIDSSKAGDMLSLTVYSSKKKTSFEVSVKLLEDAGGSGYNSAEQNSSSDSHNSDDEDQKYNQSEFNFPIGE